MFLLMWSMVMMIIGGFAITNTVYLEKFYLTNKKENIWRIYVKFVMFIGR